MSEHKSFFSTLPGILTGFAALITAVAGLLYALSETGVLSLSKTEKPITETSVQKDTSADLALHPLQQTTDGWAIIGKIKQGVYSDLSLMVHRASPAIGRSYDAVKDFRLVQKRNTGIQERQQTITLGMVH